MLRVPAFFFVAACVAAACSSSSESQQAASASSTSSAASSSSGGGGSGGMGGAGGSGGATPDMVTFPKTFLWGSATAGEQIEKGLDTTDWYAWANLSGKIANGDKPDDGPDAWSHVDDDIANMTKAGLSAYRFSIELSRVYPTRADFDADTPDMSGLMLYDDLVDKLAAAGISPMVTLHHFAWPDWMDDVSMSKMPQGWERADVVDVFSTWCSRMATRYGDKVKTWVTINEPNVETSLGYLASIWPPGISDTDRMAAAQKAQLAAHAACYDAIHAASKDAQVSMALHQRVYLPADPTNPDDVAAAKHSDSFWNLWYLNAIVKGNVDENFDDKIDASDDQDDPKLKGRFDYLGINYYGVSIVNSLALKLPYLGNEPMQSDLHDGRPETDVGWDIYPEGFGVVLDEAAKYGLPIVITENGIADADDVNRSRYLLEHVFQIGLANLRGDDVRGYFHWSLFDNFEWASGYCPKFGLYKVDLTSSARTRTATKAVALFQKLATTDALTKEEIDATPQYQSMPVSCSSF